MNTLKKKGLAKAFDMFSKLYETDPSIPKNCHSWGHTLGVAAYGQFKDKKSIILRPEAAYCGYGFYHGFMERSLLDQGDINDMKEFCEYARTQLKDDDAVYPNCIHGIGHGAVNIDDATIWGDFEAMIEPGLTSCEQILDDNLDLITCWEGAFNAMALIVNDDLYQFEFNLTDQLKFFDICRRQKDIYKKPCYFEFLGMISQLTNHDFNLASNLLLKENLSKELNQYLIFKMAGDFMQFDIVNETHEKNVIWCRNLPNYLYEKCFAGVISGFIGHGDPKKAYIKGLAFCEETVLEEDDKNVCYKHIVSSTVPKNSRVCRTIPLEHQKYCNS